MTFHEDYNSYSVFSNPHRLAARMSINYNVLFRFVIGGTAFIKMIEKLLEKEAWDLSIKLLKFTKFIVLK
jgi:hypothetical protein